MKNNGSGRMPGKGKVSMKKMLAVILALTLILPMACISSSAEYAGYDRLDGCENIFLSYTFNCNNWSYGRRTVEGYEPLVGYYDTDGDLIDTFFDTFPASPPHRAAEGPIATTTIPPTFPTGRRSLTMFSLTATI